MVNPCTCHPDDNPPRPCPQKYALSECRAAANGKTRVGVIAHIDHGKTALTSAVRAALADGGRDDGRAALGEKDD